MERPVSPTVGKFGYWSAVLASLFSIVYVIGQFAEWLGWLGSGGGPENASTALGLIVLLVPSLLLGPSFLMMMVAAHYYAGPDRKIWSHAGVAFATMYCTLICINYFVQLTFVVPHMLRGDLEPVRFVLFTPFDSFTYSVDILGYSFMSLATLFGAFILRKEGLEGKARFFMIANGLLVPFLVFQLYYHPLIWPASLWAVTFPASTIALAMLFRRHAASEVDLMSQVSKVSV